MHPALRRFSGQDGRTVPVSSKMQTNIGIVYNIYTKIATKENMLIIRRIAAIK